MKAVWKFIHSLLGLAGVLSLTDAFLAHFPKYEPYDFYLYGFAMFFMAVYFIVSIRNFEKESTIPQSRKNMIIQFIGIPIATIAVSIGLIKLQKDNEIEAPLDCVIPLNEIPAEEKKDNEITVRFSIKNHDNLINKTKQKCELLKN